MAPSKPDDPLLATLLDRLERTPVGRLRLLAVRPLDTAGHDRARAGAEDAARRAGRAERHAVARAWLDDLLRRSFSQRGFAPAAALGIPHEPLGPVDRVRVERTIDDALLAVLVRDLVDETTYDELLGPCAGLLEDDAAS